MQRGRPRAFDLDLAIDGAMDLFWRKGYRNTTTRELEAALGIAPSSLYKAFGSKARLMNAVLDRYQGLIGEALIEPLLADDAGLNAIDRFLAGLGGWLAAGDSRGCLIGRMMSEAGQPHADVAESLARYRAKLRGAIGAALRRAAAAGEIPRGTVRSRTEVVIGMVLGLNLAVQAGYDPDAQRALLRGMRTEVARWGERADAEASAARSVAAASNTA